MEGISFQGMRADSANLGAPNRMPQLRILILDNVKTDSMLSGIQFPSLAMLSWRGAFGPSLPCAVEAIESGAVLDVSWNVGLERLPAALQARLDH